MSEWLGEVAHTCDHFQTAGSQSEGRGADRVPREKMRARSSEGSVNRSVEASLKSHAALGLSGEVHLALQDVRMSGGGLAVARLASEYREDMHRLLHHCLAPLQAEHRQKALNLNTVRKRAAKELQEQAWKKRRTSLCAE